MSSDTLNTVNTMDEVLNVKLKTVLDFLKYIEENKIWTDRQQYFATCGYTGPGIAVILLLFDFLGITNKKTFHDNIIKFYVDSNKFYAISKKAYNKIVNHLKNVINEVIGNFLDLSTYCPETAVEKGIMGLIKQSKQSPNNSKVKLLEVEYDPIDSGIADKNVGSSEGGFITYHNLTIPGVNLLSFTDRDTSTFCSTFHHAVVYIVGNRCYVIDSWAAGCELAGTFEYRFPTVREFDLNSALIDLSNLVNTQNVTLSNNIMLKLFYGHTKTFIYNKNFLFNIFITENSYLTEIFNKIFNKEGVEGVFQTNFGGRRHSSGALKLKRISTKKRKNNRVKKQNYKSYKNKRSIK
jgi:hypothetical protein